MKLVKGSKFMQDWTVIGQLYESDSRSLALIENENGGQSVLIVDSIPNFGDFSLKKVKEYRSQLLSLQQLQGGSGICTIHDFRIFRRSDESYYDAFIVLNTVLPLSLYLQKHVLTNSEQMKMLKNLAMGMETYHANKLYFGSLHAHNIFCTEQGDYCLGIPEGLVSSHGSEKEDFSSLAQAFCAAVHPELQKDSDEIDDLDEYLRDKSTLSLFESPAIRKVLSTAADLNQGYESAAQLLQDLSAVYPEAQPEVISLSAADLKKEEYPAYTQPEKALKEENLENEESEESEIQDSKVHQIFDNVFSAINSLDPNAEPAQKESPKEKLSNLKKNIQESLNKKEEETQSAQEAQPVQAEPEIRLRKKVVRSAEEDSCSYAPKKRHKRKHPMRMIKRVIKLALLLLLCFGAYKGYQFLNTAMDGEFSLSLLKEKISSLYEKIINLPEESTEDNTDQSDASTAIACENGQVYNYYTQSCEWVESNDSSQNSEWSTPETNENEEWQQPQDSDLPQTQPSTETEEGSDDSSLPEAFINEFGKQLQQGFDAYKEYFKP